jgi:hypothetical protein
LRREPDIVLQKTAIIIGATCSSSDGTEHQRQKQSLR